MFDAAPAQLVSVKDWALARTRARIYSGEFQPGVKLSIDSLATELGVSRTPIRDAFGQLEREGLVTITSRVGVFVRRLTRSEAEDIYRIKEAIEPLMARWAAERPSAAQRAEYRDNVAGLATFVARGDVDEYIRHLEYCRRELLRLAGSSPLHDIMDAIDGRVSGRASCRSRPASIAGSPTPWPGAMGTPPSLPCSSTCTIAGSESPRCSTKPPPSPTSAQPKADDQESSSAKLRYLSAEREIAATPSAATLRRHQAP